MTTKQHIDPRTPIGKATLRYRGYRTEDLLRELGLDPKDKTRQLASQRQHQSRDELIAQLVAMKLPPASKLAPNR
ncbi:hypothetical protein E8L62_01115 [Escherichia coli]|nr:hypothetical protein [Escherichia coli]